MDTFSMLCGRRKDQYLKKSRTHAYGTGIRDLFCEITVLKFPTFQSISNNSKRYIAMFLLHFFYIISKFLFFNISANVHKI
jgi:hypothetical protein